MGLGHRSQAHAVRQIAGVLMFFVGACVAAEEPQPPELRAIEGFARFDAAEFSHLLPAQVIRERFVVCARNPKAARQASVAVARVMADLELETGVEAPPGIVYVLDAESPSNEHPGWIPDPSEGWIAIPIAEPTTERAWCAGLTKRYARSSHVLSGDEARRRGIVSECVHGEVEWVAIVASPGSHRADFKEWFDRRKVEAWEKHGNRDRDFNDYFFEATMMPWVWVVAAQYEDLDGQLVDLQRREALWEGIAAAMPLSNDFLVRIVGDHRRKITKQWDAILKVRRSSVPP
jgi:hypothetical protein